MVDFSVPSRRALLKGAALSSVGFAIPSAIAKVAARPAWRSNPFSLGVATGAPSADGFVLWTKLAPTPLSDDPSATGGMTGPSQPINYEIATDDAMHHVVQRGAALAEAKFGARPFKWRWYAVMNRERTTEEVPERVSRCEQTSAPGHRGKHRRALTELRHLLQVRLGRSRLPRD